MTNFPLQHFVETHGCKYFAENDTGDGFIVNLALQSPFIRLYALNRRAAVIEKQKYRFSDNERVQLFNWTHDACWTELVKLVPAEHPAVFWIHATENVGRGLITIGRLRPLRQDVVIFDFGVQRGVLSIAEAHFNRTHRLARWWSSGFPEMVYGWESAAPAPPTALILFPRVSKR